MATASDRDRTFQADVRAYLNLLPELLKKDAGKYVLIGRADKYGVYGTRDEALDEGVRVFEKNGFIVRFITEEDLRTVREWLDACPASA